MWQGNLYVICSHILDGILQPLVADIKRLERGYEFSSGKFGGYLLACKGDTPAVAELCGFKEGVGRSFRKCRTCMVTTNNMNNIFLEEECTLRNVVQHNIACERLRQATGDVRNCYSKHYGINRASCLLELKTFDITQDTPFDVMHVICEGYAHTIILLILEKFIDGRPQFLTSINRRIKQFQYSYADKDTMPGPLIISTQTSKLTKQKASQMKTLLKVLPMILSELVDLENHYFLHFVQFAEIVQIVYAPVLSVDTVNRLKDLINRHLVEFRNLYDKDLIPKMHYLLHIPRQILLFGPPCRWSCLHEEAKHKRMKEEARKSNFWSVSKTLSQNHQKYDNATFSEIGKRTCNEPVFGAIKRINNPLDLDDQVKQFLQVDDRAWKCKHATLSGTKYIVGKTILVVNVSENEPIFGKIEEMICINKKKTLAKFQLYETDEYVPALCGYRASKTDLTHWHSLNDIIDYKPITEKSTSATEVILLPEYWLQDAMALWTLQR